MTQELDRRFGEVRSLFERAETRRSFARVLALVDEAYDLDRQQADERWMPYVLEKLDRWATDPGVEAPDIWHTRRGGGHRVWEAIFEGRGWLRMLRSLDLGPRITNLTEIKALAACPHLGEVRAVSLRSCRLESKGLKALIRADAFPKVTHLSLYNNTVRHAGMKALASSALLGRLEHLDVGKNKFGDRGMAEFLKCPELPRLRHLGLSWNELDDPSATGLGEATQFPALEGLELGDNELSNNGYLAILNAEWPSDAVKDAVRVQYDAWNEMYEDDYE